MVKAHRLGYFWTHATLVDLSTSPANPNVNETIAFKFCIHKYRPAGCFAGDADISLLGSYSMIFSPDALILKVTFFSDEI